MAGEKARQAAQELIIKSDELQSQIVEKERQVNELMNKIGHEKLEAGREAASLAQPGNTTLNTVQLAESGAEISASQSDIDRLQGEIVEMKTKVDKYRQDSQTLDSLAEAAEAAEGQANDAAERSMSD